MTERSFDDEDLVAAVAASTSWRGVLRHLGLTVSSSSSRRVVQRDAARLGLDVSHFTGQRRWRTDDLASAVAASRTWAEVVRALGLSGGSSETALKGHATRLGLDFGHFIRSPKTPDLAPPMQFDQAQLPRAGGLLASAWFTLCGYEVSWPLEPCRYDLVAVREDLLIRVQVKTTRFYSKGSWMVSLSTGGRQRDSYDPDDIDYFFIIDGDFDYYLIPVAVVAGYGTITLAPYEAFRLAQPLAQPT